jgi:putative transposase
MEWLYIAKRRFGLRVLNFTVTRNHIHLLVMDSDKPHVIPSSLQLVAGRTAQEFNLRKNHKGAFWEDRYHATAIENGTHLANCITYIDLNMVRAGSVSHPIQWKFGAYYEMERQPSYKKLVDYGSLLKLLDVDSIDALKVLRRIWVEEKMATKQMSRESQWTESVAVGSREFLEKMKKIQGLRTEWRAIEPANGSDAFQLRDKGGNYCVFNIKKPRFL